VAGAAPRRDAPAVSRAYLKNQCADAAR
jgi:hypothetical protein